MAEQINPLLRMNISTGKYVPNVSSNANKAPITNGIPKQSFGDVLKQVQEGNNQLKYSAHALKRLQDRNINFSDEDVKNIKNAVELAGNKGVKESLVVIKDVALIINIPNSTVITAVDKQSLKNNVFTNIDGAVFI